MSISDMTYASSWAEHEARELYLHTWRRPCDPTSKQSRLEASVNQRPVARLPSAHALALGVLWSVGGRLDIDGFGMRLAIPGYLVIAVVLYSLLLTAAMIPHRPPPDASA